MGQKAIKIVRHILVILFLSYYAGSTLFFHTHIFNGDTVSHSHPYWPSGSHSHSEAQYEAITNLGNIVFTIVEAATLVVVAHIITLLYTPRLCSTVRNVVDSFYLRGPPLCGALIG